MKKLLLFIVCLLSFLCIACNDTPVEVKKELKEIQIKVIEQIEIGEVVTLEAIYDQEITVDLQWSSSDNIIALVFGNEITGKKDGVVTVTVTDTISGISANIEVTVGLGEVNIDTLLDWAVKEMGTEGYDEVEIITKHPTIDCTFEWTSSDSSLFDVESGFLGLFETDKVVSLTCKATYNGESKEKTYDYTVLGYAVFDVVDEFMAQIKANKIFYDMSLNTSFDLYDGATVEWSSSDESIFSNKGVLNKPLYETEIELTLVVKIPSLDVEKEVKKVVFAQPMNIQEKCEKIEAWINSNVAKDGYLYKDTILPDYIDDYQCNLEWFNESGTELKLSFSAENPILGDGINTTIKVSDGISTEKITLSFKTMAKEITDSWEKIKLFTDTIASSALTSFSYVLVSWTDIEKGYIPFYDTKNCIIKQDIIPYTDGRVRTGIPKTSTEYVVVHDTGMPNEGNNAEGLRRYINSVADGSAPGESDTYKSWHFSIGNDGIYQHLPLDEVGYHAGDGSHVFGDVYHNTSYNKTDCIGGGNRNGIGIESCIDKGSDYTYTMRYLAKLVAELLIKYNLGFDRIKQHWHFSGKNCPQVMRQSNRWNEFLYLVKLEYFAKTELQGVEFEWTSLTPDIMDNTGKVIKQISVGTTVSYKVKVTYNGEVQEFTYQSKMSKRI